MVCHFFRKGKVFCGKGCIFVKGKYKCSRKLVGRIFLGKERVKDKLVR
jgi:hypothetical protein